VAGVAEKQDELKRSLAYNLKREKFNPKIGWNRCSVRFPALKLTPEVSSISVFYGGVIAYYQCLLPGFPGSVLSFIGGKKRLNHLFHPQNQHHLVATDRSGLAAVSDRDGS